MKRFLVKRNSGAFNNGQIQRRRNRLTKTIVRQDWKGLLDLLDSSGKKSISSSSSSSTTECNASDSQLSFPDDAMLQALLLLDTEMNRSALHMVCRSHPPFQVVQRIVRVCPGSVKQTDKSGHTPLHSAAEWGASPRIIEFLIKRFPGAASMVDVEGKTPLHLCCENCCFEDSSDTGAPWLGEGSEKDDVWPILAKGPLLPVVKTLLRASPEVVNVEDNEDMNALEYAIMFNADVKIVKALQKASTEAWKMKKPALTSDGRITAEKIPSWARTSVSSSASEGYEQGKIQNQVQSLGSGSKTVYEKSVQRGLPAIAKLSIRAEPQGKLKVPKAA